MAKLRRKNPSGKITLLLFLGWAFINQIPAQINEFPLEQISSQNSNLSQDTIICILEDSTGFLWFGTYDGLNRYDGYRFKTFRHDTANKNSLDHHSVLSLCQSRDGRIWAGTSNFVNILDPITNKISRLSSLFPGLRNLHDLIIISIQEGKDGEIWMLSQNHGLIKYSPAPRKISFCKDHSSASDRIKNLLFYSFVSDLAGNIWINSKYELFQFNEKTGWISFAKNPIFQKTISSHFTSPLYKNKSGDILFSTPFSLNQMSLNNGNLNQVKSYNYPADNPETTWAGAILEDSKQQIWMGSKKGFHIFNRNIDTLKNAIPEYTIPKQVSLDNIKSIWLDRNGLIWIGTFNSGIFKYNPGKKDFNHFKIPSDNSLRSNNVLALLKDSKANLWIGTFNGLHLFSANGKKHRQMIIPNEHSNPNGFIISSLLETREGKIWAGTWNDEIFQIEKKGETIILNSLSKQINPSSSTAIKRITCFFETDEKNILIGTYHNGLRVYSKTTGKFSHNFFLNQPTEPLTGKLIHHITEDRRGQIWFATYGDGIWILNPDKRDKGRWTRLSSPIQLSSNFTNYIHINSENIAYIGTTAGLNIYNPQSRSIIKLTVKEGLSNNTVYGILEDNRGIIWLSTGMGVSKYDPGSQKFVNYDYSDGLQGNDFNPGAAFKSAEGQLYLGGTRGFNSFYPGKMKKNSFIPNIACTGVTLYTEEGIKSLDQVREELTISYTDSLEVSFCALDFTNVSKNQFAYQLSDRHSHWIPLGTRNNLTLSNISPGSYTLRIKGSNSNLAWNTEGISINLIVTPPFYKTTWFRLLLIIFISTLIFLWYKKRITVLSQKLMFRNFCKNKKLSIREIEIFKLILEGKENKELEDLLYISAGTVKTYCYRIYKKLGVKSRIQLITMFNHIKPL